MITFATRGLYGSAPWLLATLTFFGAGWTLDVPYLAALSVPSLIIAFLYAEG